MATTPWGKAAIVEEIAVRQTATTADGEEKEILAFVQLLQAPGEDGNGESLIRFAYSTNGRTRRGPLTLRPSDIHRLRRALAKTPRLRAALAWT